MGMERAYFRFCTYAGECLQGSNNDSLTTTQDSLFRAGQKATGSSPPLEGIGSKIKGGEQGMENGMLLILPVFHTL